MIMKKRVTLLNPPFPYGPGYANAYKIKWFKERLIQLKTQRPDTDLDFVLSREDSKRYADYLENPQDYNYRDY